MPYRLIHTELDSNRIMYLVDFFSERRKRRRSRGRDSTQGKPGAMGFARQDGYLLNLLYKDEYATERLNPSRGLLMAGFISTLCWAVILYLVLLATFV